MSPTTRITLRLLEAARELEEEQAVQQDRTEQQLRALEDKLLHSEHERSEMQLLAVWVRKERDQLRDENADLLRALEERDAELKRLRAGVSRDAAIAQAQGGADVRGLARELVQTRFALALLADSAAARLAASRNDGSATQQRASVPFGHDAHKENAPPVVEAAGGLRSKGNVPEQAAEADATAGGRAANPGAESGGSFDGAIELRADALTELRNALAPLSLAQLLGAAGSGDGVRLMQILAPILLLAPPASALPANGAGGAAGGAASRRRSIAPTPGAPAAGDWRSPSPFRSSENEPSSAGSNFASSAPGSASGSAGSSGTPQSAGGAAGVSEHGDPAPVPGAGRSGLFSPGPQGSAHFPSAAPTPAHSGGADGEQAGAQQEKPDSAGAEGSAPDMNPAARPLQLLPALDATLSSALLRLLLAHSAAPGPELPRSAAESVAALLALGATVNLPLAAGATATAPPQPLAPRSPAAAAMAAAGAGAPAAGAGGEADLAVAARAAKDAGSPPGVLHAGSSLLHALVAARGREAVLSAVLAAGASVDALDGSGRSALHVAAACGHAEGAEFLLRHGARRGAATCPPLPLHAAPPSPSSAYLPECARRRALLPRCLARVLLRFAAAQGHLCCSLTTRGAQLRTSRLPPRQQPPRQRPQPSQPLLPRAQLTPRPRPLRARGRHRQPRLSVSSAMARSCSGRSCAQQTACTRGRGTRKRAPPTRRS